MFVDNEFIGYSDRKKYQTRLDWADLRTRQNRLLLCS